jgi:hypothetical protein
MNNEPDVSLAGLSIWISGRRFPQADDYWDGNWLVLRATMKGVGSVVTTEGSILTTMDFERFRNDLTAMHETLSGDASLAGYEPNLALKLKSTDLGRIDGEVQITGDHLSESHRFEFGIDQSYLPELIASCGAVLERFPIVGKPVS